jgi:hypothetical protein
LELTWILIPGYERNRSMLGTMVAGAKANNYREVIVEGGNGAHDDDV